MQLLPDVPLQIKMGRLSRYLIIAVMGIALLVLIGWEFDIKRLEHPLPALVAMNPVTAICFILTGLSFLFTFRGNSGRSRSIGKVLALIILLVAGYKIAGLFIESGWPIDQVLFKNKLKADILGNFANSMAPNSAFCFILTSIALLLATKTPGKKVLALQYLAFGLILIGWLSILGYVYRVRAFYGLLNYIPMALQTSFSFICIALALLFATADKGIMRHFTSTLSGSIAARLLIPAAVILPSALGLLRLYGYWSGAYDTEFGAAIYSLVNIVIFLVIAWYSVLVLNRRDLIKKQAEDAMRDSEMEISAIFNAAPDAVIVINSMGKIIKWNPEAEKLFEWKAEEVTGKILGDVIIPLKHREAHRRGMEKFLARGEDKVFGRTIEITALKKDDTEFDVALRVAPVNIKEAPMFVGFVRDITERKKTELRLKSFNEELSRQVEEKTKQLTEIFERITDAFVAMDNDFRCTYVNKKAAELMQRDPATMIGKRIWDEFPAAVGSPTYKAFIKAMKEQQYAFNTDHYAPLDLWHENYIYPSHNGLSVFVRDITKKKKVEIALQENEEKYKTLVEEAVDGILVLSGKNLRYLEANKKISEMLGYSAEELMTIGPNDLLFPGDHVAYPFVRLDAGETVRVEKILRRKDGTGINVEASVRRLPDGNYLSFIRDITERKKAEKELLRLNEELRKLTDYLQKVREEERTHIAREIHDELGQQLTVMKMDIAWLNKRVEDPRPLVKEKMDELLTVIDTTVKTVRRIASELRPSLLDDLGLVPAMEWHLEEFEKRSGIHKTFKAPSGDIDLADDIKVGLFRIFQESLTNVARHSKAKNVNICLEKNDKEVILSIRDDGRGFTQESTSRGTLGILGMKERTLMLGGQYIITGTPGKGTFVSVSIPLDGNVSGN